MRHFFIRTAILLSALAASVGLCAVTTSVTRDSASAIMLSFADDVCSGTAVAPRVVLTATHCFDGHGTPNVRVNRDVVAIWRRVDDGHDHTLIEVSKVFKTFSPMGSVPLPGAPVHIFGNPAAIPHLYRAGVVSGTTDRDGETVRLIQMPTFFGDSGAGVFDDQGRVVAVITGVYRLQSRGYSLQFAFAYPMAFSADDLHRVGMR